MMSNDGVIKKKGKAPGEKKSTKRKGKRRETYAVYIYKVLKQVSFYPPPHAIFKCSRDLSFEFTC